MNDRFADTLGKIAQITDPQVLLKMKESPLYKGGVFEQAINQQLTLLAGGQKQMAAQQPALPPVVQQGVAGLREGGQVRGFAEGRLVNTAGLSDEEMAYYEQVAREDRVRASLRSQKPNTIPLSATGLKAVDPRLGPATYGAPSMSHPVTPIVKPFRGVYPQPDDASGAGRSSWLGKYNQHLGAKTEPPAAVPDAEQLTPPPPNYDGNGSVYAKYGGMAGVPSIEKYVAGETALAGQRASLGAPDPYEQDAELAARAKGITEEKDQAKWMGMVRAGLGMTQEASKGGSGLGAFAAGATGGLDSYGRDISALKSEERDIAKENRTGKAASKQQQREYMQRLSDQDYSDRVGIRATAATRRKNDQDAAYHDASIRAQYAAGARDHRPDYTVMTTLIKGLQEERLTATPIRQAAINNEIRELVTSGTSAAYGRTNTIAPRR